MYRHQEKVKHSSYLGFSLPEKESVTHMGFKKLRDEARRNQLDNDGPTAHENEA
jgi:hypothetical protein